MTDVELTRRGFLRTAVAGACSTALAACGGGGDSASADTLPDSSTDGGVTIARAPGTFTVQSTASQPQVLPPGTTTRIASGATGMTVTVSPDLPPGRTLSVSAGGDVTIASAADAPAVDIGRPWVIEVMASPIATIVNATKGISYLPGQTYPTVGGQPANRWNAVMGQASHGDTIEISPGAVHSVPDDLRNYWTGLDACMLAVWKAVNLRNMAGRGRWRLYPDDTYLAADRGGIVIFAPAEMDGPVRGSVVIEGFAFDNWGNTAGSPGVKVRTNYVKTNSWGDYHQSVTFRNFKIGKRPYERSASGFNGAAENLIFEDGHVYDTGGALGAPDGNDHNFYVSARNMVLRGVRANRTRGNDAANSTDMDMDGHHLKLTAVNCLIEGCVIDCGPKGDSSYNLQIKNGGNFVVRGNLFVGGALTQNWGTGIIGFENEISGTPWFYGAEGHSLLVEKNVFVNHSGRALVYFRPAGHGYYIPVEDIASCVVRDNVGMCSPMGPYDTTFTIDRWISNAPAAVPRWDVSNTVMPYGADEPGFADKALLGYRRSAGPVAAAAGAVSTRRFQYPHGFVARTDAYQGLG